MTSRILTKQFWIDVFAIVMFVAAIGTEIHMIGIFLEAKAVQSWPTTAGEVFHSELTREFLGPYQADIRYRYEVSGQSFESGTIRTRGVSSKYRSDVEHWVETYPAGSRVEVHYNPSRPEDAYLVAGVDAIDYVIIISPLCFAFIMGGYLAWRVGLWPDGPP